MNTIDDDWSPPTEEEMKLIEARRARSDQISKLMAGYLLKGYKMLGTECSCGTILLQDRTDIKHCVACEELECDTEKDNPALRPATTSNTGLSIKQELQEARPSAAPQSSYLSGVPQAAVPSPRTAKLTPQAAAGTPRGAVAAVEEGGDYLSMSSIDIHCWPANPAVLDTTPGGGGGDQGVVTQQDSAAKHQQTIELPDSGLRVVNTPHTQVASSSCDPRPDIVGDISTSISVLQRKINWASQKLEQTSSVASCTDLCNLIKAAAEAIVAVQKASL